MLFAAPRSPRSLTQGMAGALLGAATASAAYTLLTRLRAVPIPSRPREGRNIEAAVPRPRPEPVMAGGGARAVSGSPAFVSARGDVSTGSTSADRSDTAGPDIPATEAEDPWLRTNFRGRTVTLHQGSALACGVCAATLLVPGPTIRVRAACALAAAGAAAFGVYDDLAGSTRTRGLRGHLGALARGRVTTGMVKMAGIGATGVAAAALLRRSPLDTLMDGALIATSANLLNLFDLRPGRAVKVALLAAVPALASPAAPLVGPAVGASAALLPDELAERSMLGDGGANALGAALGAAAAAGAPRPLRAALLVAVAALTLASERVSFSRVIDRVPALRRLDRWGRHE